MHSEKVSTATSTSSSENRKSSKPIMEKRRRARINASLAELKSLLLEVMKNEGNRHSKMEKADILEMTVKQLRLLQRQHFSASTNDDSPVLTKYVLGFQECASEVSRYLSSMAEVDPEIRTRLLNHLATYITSSPSFPNSSSPKRHYSSSSPLPAALVNRPTSASENSSCPSPDKVASSSPLPSRHVFAAKVPGCPTEMITSNDASSSSDSKQTISSATTNVTGVTNGILTLDASLSHIQTSKMGNVQLLATKMPACQVAFVLPASVMTDDSQQTLRPQQNYFPVPIYAPTSQATLMPMTSSGHSTGAMMALMPDVTKSGISVAPLTNMTAVPQIISFPGTLPSPISSRAQILVNGTDIYKETELSHKNSTRMSSPEMKQTLSPSPSVTKELTRNHISTHEEPCTLRVCEDENVWRPW